MNNIIDKTYLYLTEYLAMDFFGYKHHCPYWSNRMKDGKVSFRGFLNGKGEAKSIRQELLRLLSENAQSRAIAGNQDNLRLLAKRNRIGIDCSGFIYRVWDFLIKHKFGKSEFLSLDDIFPGGINRTNAQSLTDKKAAVRINQIKEIQFGDCLRLNSGRHVAFIKEITAEKLVYIHASSSLTLIQGVHKGMILIKDSEKKLTDQVWLEEAGDGDTLKKYFKTETGDGIWRLKAFA